MIDHMGFVVGDFEKSKAFYLKALAPLGIGVAREGDGWAMLGRGGRGEFWFGVGGAAKPGPIHLAFGAETQEQVRAFYDAALAAGAMDNGAPGLREQYHANYYGAFVIDPDGHNLEAVCHRPLT